MNIIDRLFPKNNSPKAIIKNMLLAFIGLFVNGFGVYLTIHANIGSGPWDVLNLGLSKTFGILYGTASISVSLLVLCIDVIMREPIGITMIIDAFTVGKAVDFFDYINIVPTPKTLVGSIAMMIAGLLVLGYTEYFYMSSCLGCGPRDTLIVGLTKRTKKIPIGVITILIQSFVTFVGYLLGGTVGIGTLIFAFGCGPIMQLAFHTVHFDATKLRHLNFAEMIKILFGRKKTIPEKQEQTK